MKVERYAYAEQFGSEHESLMRDLSTMILGGRYIQTREVDAFLQSFASFLGAGYACGTNCGTDALILAMRALGIGPGDEVITQANTFYATVAAIKIVGAKPVLVDADARTFLMNLMEVEGCITKNTKAIIPVHLYGKPTDMKPLVALQKKYNLYLIEDAAQAHGSHKDGKYCGTWGDIGCFSFHPSKNLAAAGDGGCVVSDNKAIIERCHILNSLGQSGQNNHVLLGINSKLDAKQARILSSKLPSLAEWNASRNRTARDYMSRLSRYDLQFQSVDEDEFSSYHLFTIRSKQRDELLSFLRAAEIDAVVRYPTSINRQLAFSEEDWYTSSFPVAEKLAKELLCLPLRPNMPESEVSYVCEMIGAFFQGNVI
jgi:dTDP-4-amino-4,6-dideoxygalactose transaminase